MTHVLAATSKGSWIIDSGATCHMCNDETLFLKLRLLDTPIDVTLGDGRCLKGIAEGTVKMETLLPDGSIKKCSAHPETVVQSTERVQNIRDWEHGQVQQNWV